MKKEETYKCLKSDSHQTLCNVGDITDNPFAKLAPSYFAPFKLTTKDGHDLYGDEECFSVDENNKLIDKYNFEGLRNDWTYFRFLEAAQAFIDEKNKPKFEKSDLITDGKNMLFFTDETNWGYHGYGFHAGIWSDRIGLSKTGTFSKLTPAEWESALIKEAERRGYHNPGISCKSILYKNDVINAEGDGLFKHPIKYSLHTNGSLLYGFMTIFKDGVWAEIIPEPLKEKTTEEYINEWWSTAPEFIRESFLDFLNKQNLIITKSPSNA